MSLKISAVLLVFLLGCSRTPCKPKVIAYVGGCNGGGVCGVAYTDDTSGFEYMPVRGQTVCK